MGWLVFLLGLAITGAVRVGASDGLLHILVIAFLVSLLLAAFGPKRQPTVR